MGLFGFGSKAKQSINTNGICVTFGDEMPRSYSSVLNRLESDVSSIAYLTCGYGYITVVVIIQKIDDTYCKISGSFLADNVFRDVSFGSGYNVCGNDNVTFETNLATGFTTIDDVKREIELQFNWSDLRVSDTQFSIMNHGDYVNTPFISYRFIVKK